ncbi:MAG: ornithine carbamoyltransferase [Coriobacteriia bacterium]|nr:ornithine carbamoyltransferase [Coriobacteriia bacterium]
MVDVRKDFTGRNFLAEKDFTRTEFEALIDFSAELKAMKRAGQAHRYCEGQNIALLFEKASTRTRCAFVVAAVDLGAHPEFLGANDVQLGKKESVEDTAKVLGRMFDGIQFRGFRQSDAEELGQYAGVPVWNGLTDQWHPTQMLADFLTVKEHFGYLQGITFTYCGDGRNNMANSLLVTGAKLGVNIRICAPESLQPEAWVIELAQSFADSEGQGNTIMVTDDVGAAVADADVLYTDVWVSMGEEDQFAQRIELLKPYQVNADMMARTGKDTTIFLHCLPAFHDTNTEYGQMIFEQYGLPAMEVTDEVFRSPRSLIFDQAENRMHTIKAVIAATMGKF